MIPLIKENDRISDNSERKKDLKKRVEDFTSRLKVIATYSSQETTEAIKMQIEQYKTESSSIVIEGNTPILGLSKNNWNFIYEGEDFEVSLLGTIKWLHND
jgi:hypothetical protein